MTARLLVDALRARRFTIGPMLARLVPSPLVRWFARPYVAGDSKDAGLELAASLLSTTQTLTTLDLLGEDVRDERQVAANVELYRELISRLGSEPRFEDLAHRPSVSLKPSAFTTGAQDAARAPIEALAAHAHRHRVALTIDMEDRRWTDFTLDLATELFARGWDVGTVLQTRLFRTADDLLRIPAGMRVRLVIGIYPEPAEVALTDKRAMKTRLLAYADTLLSRGAHVELASHDEEFVERFAREVAPKAPDRSEVQMLLGVPRDDLQEKLRSGAFGLALPVRLYVPFAIGWSDATAYLRRRMDESPSMVWLVLRNLARGPRSLS